MKYILLILSFLFDGLFTIIISRNSITIPLFSLMTIPILYGYYKKGVEINYFSCCFILGLFYDIVYTNTLFLNAGIFLLISILTLILFKRCSYNLISISLYSLLLIVFYRIMQYGVFSLVFYKPELKLLIKSIGSSIIINILYLMLIYLINRKKIIPYRVRIYK